jgi:hypothetical protein
MWSSRSPVPSLSARLLLGPFRPASSPDQKRSNPRTLSQSVTAALNAATSTWALLT